MEELRLQLLGPPVLAIDVRQIANKADEDLLLFNGCFPDKQLDRKCGAVLAHAGHDTAYPDDPSFARRQIAGDIVVVLLAEMRRHQDLHILADDLVRPIAEEPLGCRVEGLNDPMGINGDDPVRRNLRDSREKRGHPVRFERHHEILKSSMTAW